MLDFLIAFPTPIMDPQFRRLVVLDELMTETDQTIASLFTKKSHHRNFSVIVYRAKPISSRQIPQNHQ